MAAGARSLLAFWMGGASAPPETTQAAVKSPLAFWVGGAGVAPAPPAGNAGYRSLLAFWAGGACTGSEPTPPTPQPPVDVYAPGARRTRAQRRPDAILAPPRVPHEVLRMLDEEIIVMVASALAAGLEAIPDEEQALNEVIRKLLH